jgi:Sec-independent protein translocase protein TatA
MLAFIGSSELLVAAVVGVLLFGGRLPEVMRQVGRMWIQFRRALNDLKRESGLEDTLREIRRETDMDLSGPAWRKGMDHAAGPARKEPPTEARLEASLDPEAPRPAAKSPADPEPPADPDGPVKRGSEPPEQGGE